jgi:hypothetical protein
MYFQEKIKKSLEPNFIEFPFNEIPKNTFGVEIIITTSDHEITITQQDINFNKFVSALSDSLHVIVEKFGDEMSFYNPQLIFVPGRELIFKCRAFGIRKESQDLS